MNNKKIIVYFNLGIGNFLMLTPTIVELKKFQDKQIDIIIPISKRSKYIKEICDEWDIIDKVILWPDDEFDIKDYDVLLNPWSEDSPIRTILLNNIKKVYDINKIEWDYNITHEVVRNMSVLYDVTRIPTDVMKIYCPIVKSFADFPKRGCINEKKLIALCNSSHDEKLWVKKKAPNKLFINLMKYFSTRNIHVCVIGGREDNEIRNMIYDYLNEDLCGYLINTSMHFDLTIPQTAYIIQQSNLLITTDTAALHIASAVDTPTITLFGPTIPSKNGAWPESLKHGIIQNKQDCPYGVLPCYPGKWWLECKDNKCMQSITAGDIIDKMVEMNLWGV